MDVDVGAGRDSTRRTAADDGGRGRVARVVPPELYDPDRAKIDASLRWLLDKAYGADHNPVDLRDPFYIDQYEQEHIKPLIIRRLLSGELYCRVCGFILHAEQAASLQSHLSVLQALSRKGIQALNGDDSPVSDLDLRSAPIRMSSHICLIDALMMAYTAEMISIEKVVSSVERFSIFSASKEWPFDLEQAMVLWINKVNIKLREIVEKELKMKQRLLESPSHQKSPSKWYWKLLPVRYLRDHPSGQTLQHFPLVDDLKDVCDATALLAVIHFYCPELFRLEDICLKEVPCVTDIVYNIQLLKEFSNEYMDKCFYLKPEDMLHSPPALKNNVMVFIAELFWLFECVKPDFVQPRDLKEIRDVRLLLQPKDSRHHLPVSNVTKRSFMTSSNSADTLNTPPSPDLCPNPSSLNPSQSLLPPRHRQQKEADESISETNRSKSMSCTDGQHQAWPEWRLRPASRPVPSTLHCPLDDDTGGVSLGRSISKDSLASNLMTITPHTPSGYDLFSSMRVEDEEAELDEEELLAVIHPSALSHSPLGRDMEQDEMEIQSATSTPRVSNTRCPPRLDMGAFIPDSQADSCYLEPLMPAIPKPAKEKTISLNKEEESGESHRRTTAAARDAVTKVPGISQRKSPLAESNISIFTPIPVVESVPSSLSPLKGGQMGISQSGKKPQGFFLHLSREPDSRSAFSAALEVGQDSDSDIADLEEDEEDQMDLTKEAVKRGKGKFFEDGEACEFGEVEGESAKLKEDSKVSERDDKEDYSGCSSPCLSTASWASSCSASGSVSVKMTSFAERKLLKLSLRDGFSSTSSSQKTTPDGSEVAPCSPWQPRSDYTSSWVGKEPVSELRKNMLVSPPLVPSEQLQLHMQLEEQRRAIEYQKKKMETLSAHHRLKLGKAAFLNIVKKGGGKSDTLPLPLKHSASVELPDRSKAKAQSCKDDSCLDALQSKAKAGKTEGGQMKREERSSNLSPNNGGEIDLSKRSHSIDLLSAISSMQQQMMQLSLQQDLLMKHVALPPEHVETGPSTNPNATQSTPSAPDSKPFAVHFIDISGSNSAPAHRPPKLSSSQRSKAFEQRQSKDNSKTASAKSNAQPPSEISGGDQRTGSIVESSKVQRSIQRSPSCKIRDEVITDSEASREGTRCMLGKTPSQDPQVIPSASVSPSQAAEPEENNVSNSEKEVMGRNENTRVKGQLIEVDLSKLKDPQEDGAADAADDTADGQQKNVFGMFFKDDEKAVEEMTKRQSAFLLNQQRRIEETRLRKQQQEAESEHMRDEAKRKAEEARIRKEEEKAKRESIKQKYLQKKLNEDQGLVEPRQRTKSRRSRPTSLHREEASRLAKGSTTPDLSCSHRGSTLSLATGEDSVFSDEGNSQRAGSVCSTESFPMLSRVNSRKMERDWDKGSIASSITSAEYNGPKLFKEPSSKSNKPIIMNAIAHCCLPGRVNEAQKNAVLEELEKCKAHHFIILFRDGGCQFRAIYSFSPDTQQMVKFTGTGPQAISQRMVDKLYKYNSDRKQFTVIPAKSLSVTIDAVTIHNHLWQVKRRGSARGK